jgi:predicted acyl esterase
MRIEAAMTRLDRPGVARYALRRLTGLLHPPVIIYEPTAGSVSVLRDLPVAIRDGTVLGVNVVLPAGGGRFPVLSRRTGFHIIKKCCPKRSARRPRG